MIKVVIFDMDGLMFDTESAYSVVQQNMSRRRNKVFTIEVKRTLMGKRAVEVMTLLKDFWETSESVEELLAEQDMELINEYKQSVEKLPGLDELLEFLTKHSIRKCIGTSSRRFLVDILLEKHALAGTFETIITGDMVEKGKPDPEIYNLCLKWLQVEAVNSLVLEDSLNGVKAGVAAGCKTCAVPSEYTADEDFSIANITVSDLESAALKSYLLS